MRTAPLACDIILPEVERQLVQDRTLWPNIDGYFKQPIITNNPKKLHGVKKTKANTVKIVIEDSDLLNFITGGLTGIKAYVNRRIKIRGDLVLAQSLENLFEKSGGRERALEYMKKNELPLPMDRAKL
ncbi:hypothetical protein BC940DRAFT_248145 [Gongronella butleri]|nr:hypothetical protein BC940DRAFT_248145 [Gongronella butleri]